MKTPLTNLISIAVKKASNNVLRDFNEIDFLLNKPDAATDFANNSNIRAQKTILEDLMKFKNTYSARFKSLNPFNNKDQSNFFIINGILGLTNFARGIPNFCISVALERDSKIFASVIFNPITNELFTSESGTGSYCNSRRLRISENRIDESIDNIISTDLDYIISASKTKNNFAISNNKALDICYLASSKFNDCLYKSSSPAYDLLPSLLVANEAGYHFDMEYDDSKKIKIIKNLSNKNI